jgi:hypothetical protein
MPLSTPAPRQPIHERRIELCAFEREDGLLDIESHLVDTKPFSIQRRLENKSSPAGTHLHDLSIRFTVNSDFIIQSIEASSDRTPYSICAQAQTSLSVLIGDCVGKGWTKLVKDKLRGTASCTHLMELLIPMATVTFQAIKGLKFRAPALQQTNHDVALINSCYAYADHREVVMKLWPHQASHQK